MLAAKKPIIYAGGGVVQGEGSEKLIKLTQTLGFPVTNTLMGLGIYPATDKQFLGMLGMHGTYEANMAMHEADVILAVGARFDDRVTNSDISKFCPNATILHIDIDPASISKTVTADVPIVGPVKSVLKEMNNQIKASSSKVDTDALKVWWENIEHWRQRNCLGVKSDGELIKPQQAIQALYEVTNGDAYVTSDVGQHQMFAAQYYHFDKPRRWINSGGLGTMGFGLPAAMGVQLAFPEAVVACVTGEGRHTNVHSGTGNLQAMRAAN